MCPTLRHRIRSKVDIPESEPHTCAIMNRKSGVLTTLLPLCMLLVSCTGHDPAPKDPVNDPFPEAQAELKAIVESIATDAMTADVEGLRAIHLDSQKFTKFGPRSFARQDVTTANNSEAEHFTSISNLRYEIQELKIDVFGDVAVVTYYPQVSFLEGGQARSGIGRQTLVFLKTEDGWKIVHEHGTSQF